MGIVRAAGRAGCIMDDAAFGIKVQNRVDEGQGEPAGCEQVHYGAVQVAVAVTLSSLLPTKKPRVSARGGDLSSQLIHATAGEKHHDL